MNRHETIRIYRLFYIDQHERVIDEWRWSWKAANGAVIAASTEGYKRRKRAIENLERVTGGYVRLTYRTRINGGGEFAQGTLSRRGLLGGGVIEEVFLEVTP